MHLCMCVIALFDILPTDGSGRRHEIAADKRSSKAAMITIDRSFPAANSKANIRYSHITVPMCIVHEHI